MEISMESLRYKEVISTEDGSRYGFVGDVSLDTGSGQIKSLIIHGKPRLFGLLGRDEDYIIPWNAISRLGEDIILVKGSLQRFLKVP